MFRQIPLWCTVSYTIRTMCLLLLLTTLLQRQLFLNPKQAHSLPAVFSVRNPHGSIAGSSATVPFSFYWQNFFCQRFPYFLPAFCFGKAIWFYAGMSSWNISTVRMARKTVISYCNISDFHCDCMIRNRFSICRVKIVISFWNITSIFMLSRQIYKRFLCVPNLWKKKGMAFLCLNIFYLQSYWLLQLLPAFLSGGLKIMTQTKRNNIEKKGIIILWTLD